MNFWQGKKVVVTGGAGFVGSHLTEMLVNRDAKVTVVDSLKKEGLRNLAKVKGKISLIKADLTSLTQAKKACQGQKVVLHLAAKVAGIGYNRAHPGTMFRENVLINTNTLEAARLAKVERFLMVSSACVYPPNAPIPVSEEEGFKGEPEPANVGYGWSKRVAEIQSRLYAQEFGMKIGIVRPFNCYGPRDYFDPERCHVIPALIKRIFDGEDPLTVWGNGEQSRAFLYVEDFARGLMEAIEKYPVPDPINIGTNEEIKIKGLVKLLLKLSGKSPKVIFDTSEPAGQPRRNCDTKKAKEKIGFEAKIKLKEGLRRTITWYQENWL